MKLSSKGRGIILAVASAVMGACVVVPQKLPIQSKNQQVFVLHGIRTDSDSVSDIANALSNDGYKVHNIDYPSTDLLLGEIVEYVQEQISELTTEDTKSNFVCFSMGCLVTRGVLNEHRPPNLGKVVMIAAPNHGSEVTDALKDLWLYKKLYGPAGQQIGTDQTEIEALLGEVNYEVGVIAGNRSYDLVRSIMLPGEDDGVVSVESTKIDNMQDHIVIPETHGGLKSSYEVHQQMLRFLIRGKFAHEDDHIQVK